MQKSEGKAPKWFSIGQAASYLGVSRDTLRRWEKRGKLTAVRSPSNRRYYTQLQLDAAMGQKSSPKESPSPIFKKSISFPSLSMITLGAGGFLLGVFFFFLFRAIFI